MGDRRWLVEGAGGGKDPVGDAGRGRAVGRWGGGGLEVGVEERGRTSDGRICFQWVGVLQAPRKALRVVEPSL